MIRELSVMFLKYKILKIRIMSLKENQFNKIDKKRCQREHPSNWDWFSCYLLK